MYFNLFFADFANSQNGENQLPHQLIINAIMQHCNTAATTTTTGNSLAGFQHRGAFIMTN